MKFKNFSLSSQLVTLVGLILVLSVGLNTFLTLRQEQRVLQNNIQERGRLLVNLTSNLLFNSVYFLDVSAIDDSLNTLLSEEGILFAMVQDGEGNLLRAAGTDLPAADISQRLTAAATGQQGPVALFGEDQLLVAGPIAVESVQIGTLVVGFSLQSLQQQISTNILNSLIGSTIWILVGLGGTIVVARYLVGPIQSLATAAEAVSRERLEVTVQPSGGRELKTLGISFNKMIAELKASQQDIEKKVNDRTRQLETIAGLSEQLNAILNVDELLSELVNQVQNKFNYYHTHIYLLDEPQERLVVAEGYGAAGAKMKQQGHSIRLDAPTSLVARAARNNEIVRVDDVRQAPDWLPNPLLPDTVAEMAVPIVVEGQVAGVLDVQASQVGGLDDGDANLLRSLSNQVAVAIRNARLFQQVESALAQARVAQERYVEQTWQKAKLTASKEQYIYTRPGVSAPNETKTLPLAELHRHQTFNPDAPTGVSVTVEEEALKNLVVPLQLHKTMIGALQIFFGDNPRAVTEDDLAIIQAVVDQFVQTAETLRLFDETQQRAARERLARQITDKVRSSRDIETALQIAAQELNHALGASKTIIDLQIDTQPQPEPDVAEEITPVEQSEAQMANSN